MIHVIQHDLRIFQRASCALRDTSPRNLNCVIFTHPHAVQNLYDFHSINFFLYTEHWVRYNTELHRHTSYGHTLTDTTVFKKSSFEFYREKSLFWNGMRVRML